VFLLDYANDRDTETNKSDGHTVNMESTACPSFFRGGVAGGNGKDPRGYLDFDTRPAKSSTRREPYAGSNAAPPHFGQGAATLARAGRVKCFVCPLGSGKADHPQNRDAMGGIKCNAIGSSIVNDQHPEQNIQTRKGVYDAKYYAMA